MRCFEKYFAVIITIGLLTSASPRLASAQESIGCRQLIRYSDLNGDGQPDAMTLACQFVQNTIDRLAIYKQAGDFLEAVSWQQNITYQDETWIFDHGSQGRASLIINFKQDDTALVAELYDDRDGDGQVAYELDQGRVVITENLYWTVRVVAPDGWWIRDGELNYNLNLQIDGNLEGMFMAGPYTRLMETDGAPDYDIQIYDQNHNGRPEFDKRMILTPVLQESVGLQTQMMTNWRDDELPISGGFNLWPYLDLAFEPGGGSMVGKGYTSTPPPIKFVPDDGRIEAVSEFVASRSGEHNCFYYSGVDWLPEQVNRADFENPFCFYDLAEDDDRIPELQVRAAYWFPNDRNFINGAFDRPYETIRYSWDSENSQTWRYAVGLVGRHLMEDVVTMADLDVLTVPYEDFPAWVTERSWDMAVFSEFTGKSYFTSEGNYSVSYPENLNVVEYLTGIADRMPSPAYEPDPDFKMEWAMDYQKQPILYFSPVDRRLHLYGASAGIWQIDGSRSIQYKNLGGDELIDQWIYAVDGFPVKSLVALSDWMILSESNSITLQNSEATKNQFTTLPPRDHQEWLILGDLLRQNMPSFTSDNFRAMLEQFFGVRSTIAGATLRSFRLTDQGFRFIIALQEGYEVSGQDWLSVTGRSPGEYIVRYDGNFHIQALTPSALQINIASPQAPYEVTTEYLPIEIQANLTNTGLEDAQQVRVDMGESRPGQLITWTDTQTVTVFAGETVGVLFPWTPGQLGEWDLRLEVRLLDPISTAGNPSPPAGAGIRVQVRGATANSQQFMSLGGAVRPEVLAFLAGSGLLAGLIFLLLIARKF